MLSSATYGPVIDKSHVIVTTMIGDPKNLIIADKSSWSFAEFFIRMAPISSSAFLIGLLTTFYMALPYTIVLTVVGMASVYFGLLESTEWLYQQNLIEQLSSAFRPRQ
ncbi:MAG: Na+/H+ antiporter NhaB [Glaciecola sp.]|jgi:Na+/H+ antiporter NhaB